MSAPTRSLQDTVVVVTGAGGGIGGATARLALEAGAKVVAGDIREDAVRPLLDEFGADRVALAIGDVRQEATGDALVAAGVAAFGRVDSVVANAGIGFYGGLLDVDADQIGLMIDVNLKGTIWLARAAVRQFRAQGDGGDIVVIGSVAGLLIGGGKEAVYAATKGAQINLGTRHGPRAARRGHPHDRHRAGGGQHARSRRPTAASATATPTTVPFMEPADIAGAVLYTLSQPRRMRTELWTMWSLAEQH